MAIAFAVVAFLENPSSAAPPELAQGITWKAHAREGAGQIESREGILFANAFEKHREPWAVHIGSTPFKFEIKKGDAIEVELEARCINSEIQLRSI
jgi:hypothetical protein